MIKNKLIKKFFYRLLLPTMLINLVSSVGALADSIIVGNLIGEQALVAVVFNSPLFMLINTIGALLAIGGLNVAGKLLGEGDGTAPAKYFSLSLSVILFFGVMFALIGAFFMDEIAYFLGSRGELIPLTSQYGRVILYGTIIFLLNVVLGFFIRLEGKANLAMGAILLSIFLNIVLDYIFIKFSGFGVMGAALALVVSQLVSLIIMSSHFFSKSCTLVPKLYFRLSDMMEVIKSGIGTAAGFVYRSIALLLLNNIIYKVSGQMGMEVYVVIFYTSLIAMTIFEGVSQTMQPFISTYFGEGNNTNIKTSLKLCFQTGLAMSAVVVVLLMIFAKNIVMMFGTTSPDIIAAAESAVRVYAPVIFFMVTNVILSYYFQATAHEKIAMIMVPLRELVLLVPSVLIMGIWFSLNGLWFGYLLAEVLTLAICILLCKLFRKPYELPILLLDNRIKSVLHEVHYGDQDLLYKLDDYPKAKDAFEKVMKQNKSILTDQNLVQLFLNGEKMYLSSDAKQFLCDLPNAEACPSVGISRFKLSLEVENGI